MKQLKRTLCWALTTAMLLGLWGGFAPSARADDTAPPQEPPTQITYEQDNAVDARTFAKDAKITTIFIDQSKIKNQATCEILTDAHPAITTLGYQIVFDTEVTPLTLGQLYTFPGDLFRYTYQNAALLGDGSWADVVMTYSNMSLAPADLDWNGPREGTTNGEKLLLANGRMIKTGAWIGWGTEYGAGTYYGIRFDLNVQVMQDGAPVDGTFYFTAQDIDIDRDPARKFGILAGAEDCDTYSEQVRINGGTEKVYLPDRAGVDDTNAVYDTGYEKYTRGYKCEVIPDAETGSLLFRSRDKDWGRPAEWWDDSMNYMFDEQFRYGYYYNTDRLDFTAPWGYWENMGEYWDDMGSFYSGFLAPVDNTTGIDMTVWTSGRHYHDVARMYFCSATAPDGEQVWHKILSSSGEGGSIATTEDGNADGDLADGSAVLDAGMQVVPDGKDVTYTLTPDAGYAPDTLTVDGVAVDPADITAVTDEHGSVLYYTYTVPGSRADHTVAITWKQACTVTFDSRGGSEIPPQTREQGETATEPTPPTRSGYRFVRWVDENGDPYDFTTPLTGDITLYAVWQPTGGGGTGGGSEETQITVELVWDDNDNEAELRPDSVRIVVLRNGEEYRSEELTLGKDWAYTWQLPDDGAEYTIKMITVDGYESALSVTGTTYTITNRLRLGGNGGAFALNTKDHVAYIIGRPDGTVRPEDAMTRAEAATIFFRLLTEEARAQYWSKENPFTDVAAEAWYNNAISTLHNMKIINGRPDGTFGPDEPITRAELTKMAESFFYSADTDFAQTENFTDVDDDAWYSRFITAAKERGLVTGGPDGSFRPEDNITRAEACTIINRTLGRIPDKDHLLASGMKEWPDNANVNAWYYAEMQEATNSHDKEWIAKGGKLVEIWTVELADRDWAALERTWSEAHSGR